jgi:pSer/pThr/pTyr-binding forkhead associated (FHA) protein
MKPRIIVRFEGVALRTYVLDKGCVTIGRRSDNDIQLNDPAVSGAHARLMLEPNPDFKGFTLVHLEDAGSTNGTLVNGERVQRRRLQDGDLVRVGHHELAYEETDGALETTVFLLEE